MKWLITESSNEELAMKTFVRLLNLPSSIRGMTVTDPDGNYNVYINQNLAHEMQAQTYLHEVNHIKNNDFQEDKPIGILEHKAKYRNN